jgi:hypothetical protein
MHDSSGVRERDRVANVLEDLKSLRERSSVMHVFVQPSPAHQLHGVEASRVGEHTHVVHRDDVRMLQIGEYPGFLPEASNGLGCARGKTGHLQGHEASKLAIERRVYGAHPSAAEQGAYLVPRIREIGLLGDSAKMLDSGVPKPGHGAVTPSRSRTASPYSS